MALKKIRPGEEFALHTSVYTYSITNIGSINLNKIRNIGEKQVRKPKKAFTPPSMSDVKNFFKDKGYSEEMAEKAFNHYEASEPPWYDSMGKPVIMWKQKMLNNWFKDEYKIDTSMKEVDNIPVHMRGMVM